MIRLATRTLLIFGVLFGTLAMTGLAQPPRLLAQLQDTPR
jgi:hypothetical protein